MQAVKGKDTLPEMRVRKVLHAQGFRFRLHRRDLPGKPDLVLPKHKLVIFVHGCFWHSHGGCKRATQPSTNVEFWRKKIERNQERDASATNALKSLGWRVATIWECDTKSAERLAAAIDLAMRGDDGEG